MDKSGTMDMQSEKIQLAKMLLETENPNIIESIKRIFKKNKTVDFWDELSPEQKNEIERASTEIENGELTDYDSFMQKHR
ncbi:hypothetical protein [Psychroflexus longus]|nr:hypothetical protein [Psychroflexus longus]